MKTIFLFALLLLSSFLPAQDISTHIPKRAIYIVSLNPASHIKNGDISTVSGLDLFAPSEYGRGFNYLYGDQDLDTARQTSFRKLFSDVFSNPQMTGVDTTKKIFMFNDTPDSIHYWAYVLPISNSAAFGEYVSTKLFSKKKEINKGSGFSAITSERISVGWTGSYAIILLADYDYMYRSDSGLYDLFNTAIAIDTAPTVEENSDYENAIRDSIMISDSVRAARAAQLMEEQTEMEQQLAKDSTPEEDIMPYSNLYSGYSYEEEDRARQQKIDSTVNLLAFQRLKYLMNLGYDESVLSVANFRSVNAEKADGLYWYNYGEKMSQYYNMSHMYRHDYYRMVNTGSDTSGIQNMWKDSYVASLVHFEGNKARMEQRFYFSPAVEAQTKGLYSGKVDKKMFRYVKGENLMGFTAMSVDMEKFMKFYGNVYRETATNSMLGLYENYYMAAWDILRVFLDEKTMYNLFDGDFLFAVTDLKPFTSSYVSYDYDGDFNRTEVRRERTEVRPEFILMAGLGKTKKVQQIVDILARVNAVKQQNKNYYLINVPGEYDMKVFLAIHKGMLIITNNEDLMMNNLDHGYSKSKSVKSKLVHLGRKSALVAWWDGQKSFELLQKNEQEHLSREDKKLLEVLKQNVNNGTIIGKRADKGVQRLEITMELNNTETGAAVAQSSFVRFFRLLNSLFLVHNND